ncbi:histidine phosphatase family protein, partial [bacterium]|nr:histidine phosphatase family protein [bacterium]
MLEIYLFRHGETEWSKSGKHTGLTDLPLTKEGVEQAKALAKLVKGVKFEAVYCSPLERAKETCKALKLLDSAIINSDLLEWDYGSYEGKTSKEIQKFHPGWTIFNADPIGGETSEQVRDRADRLMKELLKYDGKIALFSSGHFLRCFVAHWLGFPITYGRFFPLSTASLSILS